jgi:hypothetical protein
MLDAVASAVLIASMTSAPTFRQIFHGIWNMTADVLRQAPRLVLMSFVILIMAELAKVSFPETHLGNKALRELIDLLRCTALVLINIALYRLLLLTEQSSDYRFDSGSSRFRRFLVWSLVFQAFAIPFMLFGADGNGDYRDGAAAIALLVLLIAEIYVGLRLTLLLPALAAGAEDVSWRDAWADSRGRVWRLIKILLVPFALMIVIVLPAMMAMENAGFQSDVADLSNWRAWVRAVFDAAVSTVTELLILAAGAFAFVWVGDRVKQGGARNQPPTFSV